MRSAQMQDVFVDVCSQRDYLCVGGAMTCANAARVAPNLKRLMAFARWAHVPTLSCVDARRPNDVRGVYRASCVQGSPGQRKLTCTLLPDRVWVDSDNCLCVSLDLLNQHQQAIFTKDHRDPFTNPKLDRLLTEVPARRFVLFGALLEECVRLLALGLLLRHRQVTVVQDACAWQDAEAGDMTLRQLSAKGCEMVATSQLIAACLAERGRGRLRALHRLSVA